MAIFKIQCSPAVTGVSRSLFLPLDIRRGKNRARSLDFLWSERETDFSSPRFARWLSRCIHFFWTLRTGDFEEEGRMCRHVDPWHRGELIYQSARITCANGRHLQYSHALSAKLWDRARWREKKAPAGYAQPGEETILARSKGRTWERKVDCSRFDATPELLFGSPVICCGCSIDDPRISKRPSMKGTVLSRVYKNIIRDCYRNAESGRTIEVACRWDSNDRWQMLMQWYSMGINICNYMVM